MKITNTVLAIITIGSLIGCASTGNEKMKEQTQATVATKIVEGKTTKAEVQVAMGDATSITFTDGGNEIWTYKYSRATPQAQSFIPIVNIFSSAADVATKELIVMFDKNNIVSKYSMRETQDVVKRGIAH